MTDVSDPNYEEYDCPHHGPSGTDYCPACADAGEPIDRTPKRMCVKIRRDIGLDVKPEAELIDGKTFTFTVGWAMVDGDKYPGELAMIPARNEGYPLEAPAWIASGDLEEVR